MKMARTGDGRMPGAGLSRDGGPGRPGRATTPWPMRRVEIDQAFRHLS
jgi:hypothetical protein